MQTIRFIFLATALSAVALIDATACDLCGCYTPQLEALPQPGDAALPGTQITGVSLRGFYAGLAEQFTHFGTLQFEGNEVANPTDQHLDSSITQLVAGYSIGSRFGLQVNVPFIHRAFTRPEGFAFDRGRETGFGDVSLLGRFVLWRTESGARRELVFAERSPRFVSHEPEFTASVVLLGGVKFPTGDGSRLREEFDESEIEGAPESGIHGHDLTLGTGSYDGVFGGQVALRWRNAFVQAETQFVLRGDGRHQYHFANDITWSGGPGYYFLRRSDAILGLQAVLSGEHKDVDRFRGQRADDTGITSVFLGPRVVASWQRLSGEIGVEIPIVLENTALQAVPDYRLRAGFAFSF